MRDSPNQLRPNESALAFNWTLDERGSLKRRGGCTNVVALPGTAGTVVDIFYSEVLNLWLCVRESTTKKLFSRPGDLSGSWTDRGQIASAVSARAVFADWPGTTPYTIIGTDIADGSNGGIYTFDGTTLTKRSTDRTTALAVWQNKAWTASAETTARTRLWRSPAGDPTTFSDFVDLREKDASPLTALGVVGGALLAFKKRSAYRINDAATGAYSTIDTAAGCVNPRALAALRGRLYTWGADGIYAADGIGPLKNVGDKLQPLFSDATTDGTTICAGVYRERVVFAGIIANSNKLIEYHPAQGWAVRHYLASTSQDGLSSLARKDATLYGAISDGDDLFSMFTATPGADDGTFYSAEWQTPWLLPNSGMLARLQRLRVQGRTDTGSSAVVNVALLKGWDAADITTFDISSALLAADADEEQRAADLQSLGHSAAFAIRLQAVGTPGTGTVSIRALQLIDTPIAWPNPGYPAVQSGSRGGSGTPPNPNTDS